MGYMAGYASIAVATRRMSVAKLRGLPGMNKQDRGREVAGANPNANRVALAINRASGAHLSASTR